MKKNNYNLFKKSTPYIFGTLMVLLSVIAFYLKLDIIKNFLDKISIGNLYQIVPLKELGNITLGIFNPLAMLYLFIYGFLIGLIIESLVRKK